MKKVSLITVNFNQPLITDQWLTSVFKHNHYPASEIIVIDNGSTADLSETLGSNLSQVKYIRSESNLGFAGGNNFGIREATGDYLFLVNNDTEFTPGLVEKLVAVLDANPAVGVVSPKIRYFDMPQTIQYAGFSKINFNTGRNKCIGQFEEDLGQYDKLAGPTAYAHGAAMMVRKEAIDKAGLMPENFFLYYEEMDWCEKIRRCGYQVWVEPGALIYHKESLSVGKKSALKEYFMNRNRILFIRRNAPVISLALFYIYFVLLVIPRNLISYYISRTPGFSQLLFRALWWNITHGTNSMNLGYPFDDRGQTKR